VLKNVKNIPTWNTANCVLKHVEDALKNVVKWHESIIFQRFSKYFDLFYLTPVNAVSLVAIVV
jgi:hypothetical protein